MNDQIDQGELLRAVLKPLLEDFVYWFERAESLLENHDIPDLDTAEQADLLARVSQARSEVATAQTLFTSLGEQVAVDVSVVNQWHQLVSECWAVSMAYRRVQGSNS